MFERTLTVIDINSGLGGRSYSFVNSGFTVLSAYENDDQSKEFCEKLLGSVPISKLVSDDISSIPKADIISAGLIAPSKLLSIELINRTVSELIFRDSPIAFILQIPFSMLKRKDLFELDTSALRNYFISYKSFKESDYSGYPVSGSQTYMIGIRNDLSAGFFPFPEPKYMSTELLPILQPYNTVDPWYRKINLGFDPQLTFEENKYYQKSYPGKIIESQTISCYALRPTYYCDKNGLRHITHEEYARMKGYPDIAYNNCRNKYDTYRKIFLAPNIFVFSSIVESLKSYINEISTGQTSYITENEIKITKSGKKPKEKISVFEEQLNKPNSIIKKISINNLKGLSNVEISIDGRITAIMGLNGAGKSTILHALACSFSPYKKAQNYQFKSFFTPTPDSLWDGSRFSLALYDEDKNIETTKEYEKKPKEWHPRLSRRPQKDVIYIGIDTCLPAIEKEKQTSLIYYSTTNSKNPLAKRIVNAASSILDIDYETLTDNVNKKKTRIGVKTKSGKQYSDLTMGAGEQRLFKILSEVYSCEPYSLILIDEIDLLLHSKALERLIKKLYEIANNKHLQIIFTTHSLVMRNLKDYLDIRYICKIYNDTIVYNTINPDVVYDISEIREKPLHIYVEDDLAKVIINHITSAMHISKYVRITEFGAIENAFTIAASLVINDAPCNNILIVTDGDKYITDDQKINQLNLKLSGTESDHNNKIEKALSLITQFTLPENTAPEKYLHDLLIELDNENEITEIAKTITNPKDSHGWINDILKSIEVDENITLSKIIDTISTHRDYSIYIEKIKNWLAPKKRELNLTV